MTDYGAQQDQQKPRKLHILVAEDDTYQRLSLIDILTMNNFEVVAVENGRLARDELLGEDSDFDLVLLDLMMPEMDGYELLCLMKSYPKFNDIPVIMMSSDGEMQIVASCLSSGAADYILKPIRLQHVNSLRKHVVFKAKQVNDQTVATLANYHKIRLLGRGAAGNVDLVQRSTDNELFALKVIPMHFMNKEEKKMAENEITLLKVLNGPTIVRYYESFIENDSIYIVMEYAEKGSVHDLIQEFKERQQPFDSDQVLYWMAQIVMGIMLMHSKNILHRDIKTQNMFINKDDVIKMGDFGIAKALGTHNQFAKTFLGTPYFMAPEVCNGEAYGQKADVWAIGCALYEMVTHRRPFQADQINKIYELIINKAPDPLPDETDDNIKLLVKLMLQKDAQRRPSIWNLAEMAFIKEKIIMFAKEYNCRDSIESIYPNLYDLNLKGNNDVAKETITLIEKSILITPTDENIITTTQENVDINIDQVKKQLLDQLEPQTHRVSLFSSIHSAMKGADIHECIADLYSNLSNKQILKICETLIEQDFIQQQYPKLVKQKNKFNKSDKVLYTFKESESTTKTNKTKKEEENKKKDIVDNNAEQLDKIQQSEIVCPSLVIQKCIDASQSLLNTIESFYFSIYNLPQEFLQGDKVDESVSRFYSNVYDLQHVVLQDLESEEYTSFLLNLLQVMAVHLHIKRKVNQINKAFKQGRLNSFNKVVQQITYYSNYYPDYDSFQKSCYKPDSYLDIKYRLGQDCILTLDCLVFRLLSNDLKVSSLYFGQENLPSVLKQMQSKQIDLRQLCLFNLVYECPQKVIKFTPQSLDTILDTESKQFIQYFINYDQVEHELIMPKVFEYYIHLFGNNQEDQIRNILKDYADMNQEQIVKNISELNIYFQDYDEQLQLDQYIQPADQQNSNLLAGTI